MKLFKNWRYHSAMALCSLVSMGGCTQAEPPAPLPTVEQKIQAIEENKSLPAPAKQRLIAELKATEKITPSSAP